MPKVAHACIINAQPLRRDEPMRLVGDPENRIGKLTLEGRNGIGEHDVMVGRDVHITAAHITDVTMHSELFLAELDQEMPTSRRLLERVPTDKGPWKPHEKSFPLGHLTQLVATMPGWITRIARGENIDLSGGPGYRFQTTESLLEQFDRCVSEARAALAEFKDSDYSLPWSLTMGDRVVFTEERGKVIRQTINHFCHHRGQLTVYLRLLDIPIPSIYGPTADEKVF